MAVYRLRAILFIGVLAIPLAGCSNGSGGLGALTNRWFGGGTPTVASSEETLVENATAGTPPPAQKLTTAPPAKRGWFGGKTADPNTAIQVNKHIWAAALDVLNFLPVQSADPFTGVIVTGYGTPPGGGRAYRATILIQNGALDAGSLNVSLNTRRGPASGKTIRAIEDAILSRARQLRLGGGGS